VLGAQLVSVLPAPAAADDGDITGGIPNVLFIVDTSARMAHSAPSNAYVSTKKYPVQRKCESGSGNGRTAAKQACPSEAVVKGPTYAHYADSVSSVAANDAAAVRIRTALADAGSWSGSMHGVNVTLYTGNYINYLFASCASGGACPQPKLASARRAVSAVLDANQGVRFGILAFHQESHGGRGARVVAPIGSGVPALKSALTALTAGREAPLGDALYDAGQYFKGEPLTNGTSFPSPIELGCQPNHVILITDGVQTTGARSLTAEATLRKEQDHSTSLADVQRVTVHAIGFGTPVNTSASDSDRAILDLQQAVDNGGGAYLKAESASELEASLRVALTRITQRTYSFTRAVVPAVTAGSRRAYVASFQPGASTAFWRGSLKAYQRDATGMVPVDGNGVPLASALVWDAGRALNRLPAGRRTIYTEIDGALTPFTKTNAVITSAMVGTSSAAERNRLIDFVRGIDVTEQNRGGRSMAERSWKLGAIVHSTPVLVSAPVLALNDTTYQTFKSAQAKRTKVLIVGADDGMLHAFREADGVELWAFIAPDMLGRLPALAAVTGAHASFIDASPVAVDIKVGGTWRTIVVFGCGRGGRYYYALDITDTTSPKFLWRFTDPKIHETWSEPAIGKVKLRGQETYVAFLGGGPSASATDAYGKAVLALDLASGTKLWEYANSPDATDDRRYMTFSIPANPSAVDVDNDGYVDRVYVGDVGGQLWKFDVSAADPSSWTGKRVFAAPAGDRGTYALDAAPALALDHDRNIWIFFGVTARHHRDANSSSRFYGLRDNADMANGATLTEDSPGIKDVTAANVTPTRGWYVVLAGRGERPVGAANIFNGSVFISTVTPDRSGTCGPDGGSAKLYALGAWTGYAAIDFPTGAAVASPTASTPRARDIGRGIGSMPVVVVAPPMNPGAPPSASVIIATSNQELRSSAIPAPSFFKHLMSWRERMP
jgi:type IV pilus assembly protein PilY1